MNIDVGWIGFGTGENHAVDPLAAQQVGNFLRQPHLVQPSVGDDQRPFRAQHLGPWPDFFDTSRADEGYRRNEKTIGAIGQLEIIQQTHGILLQK